MTIENGKPYTQIDNDFLGALLLIKTTKRKIKIMLTATRLTNGFHDKEKKIPLSTLKFWTRIEKGNASKAFSELFDENMLIKDGDFVRVEGDISKWEGVINLITLNKLSKRQLKVINLITPKVINLDPYKETPKEKPKKKVLSNHQEEEKRKKNESGAHNIVAMLKGIENKTNMNQ